MNEAKVIYYSHISDELTAFENFSRLGISPSDLPDGVQINPYYGVWVEGFRLSPVPSMGTNVLFTRPSIQTYPALESATFMPSLAFSGFEYYDCSKRKGPTESATQKDYHRSIHDDGQDLEPSSTFPLPETTISTPGSYTNDRSAMVHLVVPDGSVQGTQLAHHLTSAMLCQNPALFHINAMQSVLASVLVYLLKQPFKSQGWLQRQLEWVVMSYNRAYAMASCKSALDEHERFKKYMQKLLDPEMFRLCLVSDASDHPRELKCPGLSKAILGMWMASHPSSLSESCDHVSATLLKKWKLGLTAEMFHRLGLTLEIQVEYF